MTTNLEQLSGSSHLWRVSSRRINSPLLPSGYTSLDAQLHEGGWPIGANLELLLPYTGMGELSLLLPALRNWQQQRPWIAFINPPHLPYATAFSRSGINSNSVLIVQPRSTKELLWSAEQILKSGCVGSVITWSGRQFLQNSQLRRLQIAARHGHAWHVLCRHPRYRQEVSPSALRIVLSSTTAGQLRLNIIKQRGGWGGQEVLLTIAPHLQQLQCLNAGQLPVPRCQFTQPIPVFNETAMNRESVKSIAPL